MGGPGSVAGSFLVVLIIAVLGGLAQARAQELTTRLITGAVIAVRGRDRPLPPPRPAPGRVVVARQYGLPIFFNMGDTSQMKTTVEIPDALLDRARRHARRRGRPVRELIEEGLRLVLDAESGGTTYRLPDCSVGDEEAPDPLESLSWQDLRNEIYGGH